VVTAAAAWMKGIGTGDRGRAPSLGEPIPK
jgi:hypothetical protein